MTRYENMAALEQMTTESHELSTVDGMNRYFREFIESTYGFTPEIDVKINGRLKRALGQYAYTRDNTPLFIDVAGYVAKNGTYELIAVIIKHEAIHYALHVTGKPFSDGHPYFEAELVKHGSISTGIVNFKYPQKVHKFDCGCQVHKSSTKFRKPRICTKCRGRLVFRETVEEIW